MAMTNTIHIIENHYFGAADAGETHLRARGFDVHIHKVWNGASLPELTGEEAGMLVMGGPQMVSEHEKWPYMADEFHLMEEAMAKGVPMIGICLGAQMIAHILGATVRYAPDDGQLMGYYETKWTDAGAALKPRMTHVLNGNAQGFDLPSGAKLLAYSEETTHPNQAFIYGDNVLALQFHPEVNRAILNNWQTDYAYLLGKPGTQTVAQQDAGFVAHDASVKAWYGGLLDEWFE